MALSTAFISFWAENFGHALGMILYAYSLMKAFKIETDDVQLMTIGDCCKSLRQYGQDLQGPCYSESSQHDGTSFQVPFDKYKACCSFRPLVRVFTRWGTGIRVFDICL